MLDFRHRPRLCHCGLGWWRPIVSCQRLVQCGAITTPQGSLPTRLRQIADDMHLLLAQFQPQAMAVEELFFNNNITGHRRGPGQGSSPAGGGAPGGAHL